MSPPQPEEHKPTATTGETQAKKQKGNNESVSETQQVWALEHLFIHQPCEGCECYPPCYIQNDIRNKDLIDSCLLGVYSSRERAVAKLREIMKAKLFEDIILGEDGERVSVSVDDVTYDQFYDVEKVAKDSPNSSNSEVYKRKESATQRLLLGVGSRETICISLERGLG